MSNVNASADSGASLAVPDADAAKSSAESGGGRGSGVDSPWSAVPTRGNVCTIQRRIEWIKTRLKQMQDTASTESGYFQKHRQEYELLSHWKGIAEYHLVRCLGQHVDMFQAFDPFLEVRNPLIATKFHNGREHEFLGDCKTGDHFIFEKCLGKTGQQGETRSVWKCTSWTNNRKNGKGGGSGFGSPCVIKCLVKNQTMLEDDQLRYKREFIAHSIASSFKHPNIMPLWGYYENCEMIYTLMPMGDECLFDQLCLNYQYSKCGFDEHIVRQIFRQMVSAIDFIVNIGILHRDISLENFVVYEQGPRVQLIDFGLATNLELEGVDSGKWKHVKSVVVGKLNYMAPEVFNATNQATYDGIAADLWSLGVCLFMLISGQAPYRCASVCCEQFQILASAGPVGVLKALVKAGSLNRDIRVSNSLLDILKKLLTIDPQTRMTLSELKAHAFIK